MTLELFAAATMLIGLIIYAVTGGADFGGGIWDLLARGKRAAAQRSAIEHALAPVWEANHVWLIFVIVVMFTAFPPAFARIGTELHAPLTLFLIGIVFRGSAFVFRQYGATHTQRRWGAVFAISSFTAVSFLGLVLGAMTTGGPWWGGFPVAVAVLALAASAFLAAVYLVVEAKDDELRADFRRRALTAEAALAGAALACAVLAHREAPALADDLLGSAWSIPVLGGATAAAVGVVVALRRGHHRLARAAAISVVALLLLGWGAAQYPMLIAPDLTLARAAAPAATLRALVPITLGGAVILLPSLWWLLRVFKRSPHKPT